MNIKVYRDYIVFYNYYFQVSSLSKHTHVFARDILEFRRGIKWIELLHKNGEIIFIPFLYHIFIDLFARTNQIQICCKTDIIGMLCEPYLDTDISQNHLMQTNNSLMRNGFSFDEITQIRKKIAPVICQWNSLAWEWMSIDLFDLYQAYGLDKSGDTLHQTEIYQYFSSLYHRSTENISITEKATADKARKKFREIKLYSHDNDVFKKTEWDQILIMIIDNYQDPLRHYHNLDHVLKVVELCDTIVHTKIENVEKDLLILAAWFHDIIYDPRQKANEKHSALLVRKLLCKLIDSNEIKIIEKFVLSTKFPRKYRCDEEKILNDADMSILAETQEVYQKYAMDIRQEYFFLDDKTFFKARVSFLENLLNQIEKNNHLFFYLEPLHESLAYQNLENEYNTIKNR